MSTLHEDLCAFMIISPWILLIVGNVSDKICRKNQNTHFMFSNFFLDRDVYEIMWENIGRNRQATDGSKTRRMRFASWITKATDKCAHARTCTCTQNT
jgi:hypothetical protein